MSSHYRQGDVMIRKIDTLPEGSKDVTPQGRIVLAYGEVTGHAHAIAPGETRELSWEQAGKAAQRFLSVATSGAEVKHEEHATVVLPPGLYEIIQQQEYSPEAIRNVAD